MGTRTERHDVVVVGARCAGAATARLLAARGVDVTLLERGAPSHDTLSTHGIARGGVVQLSRWGLLGQVVGSGAPPIREVTFWTPHAERVVPLKDRAGVDLLVAPRRRTLDALLADTAVASGATLRTGTTVTGLLRDPTGRVAGVAARTAAGQEITVHARHVVGADGLRSTVARQVCARVRDRFSADVSIYYAYVSGVPWRGFEFHVAEQSFAGVFPTHDGEGCVWLARPTPLLEPVRRAGARRPAAFLAALDGAAPSLTARVRHGALASPVRGAVALPNHVREAYGPGWSLVGDAGYHRDPITGHGITDAFRDAELLADAIASTLEGAPESRSLAAYQAARDDALAETYRLTRALAAFPEPSRFVELQVELADALDREAADLASRPAPAGLDAAPAA